MTTETRQIIQYVAVGLFALFTIAILGVFVYGYIHGEPPDGTILAYVGALLGTVTAILGVNSGANTAQQAIDKANANASQVVDAANGNAHEVFNALNPGARFATVPGAIGATPLAQAAAQAVSQPTGEVGP